MIQRLAPLFVALACLGAPVQAQTPPATVFTPQVEGRTVDGKPFNLASLRGKVVLLMLWSTGCAVCRDKMHELRQNYEGWAARPFELVLVSTDRRINNRPFYYTQIRVDPADENRVYTLSGSFNISTDGGRTFHAQKLGEGTWPLNACPMDGGGLVVDAKGPLTAWRRGGSLFVARPGERETELGAGKNVALAGGRTTAWSTPEGLMLKHGTAAPKLVDPAGQFPAGSGNILAWESNGTLKVARF